MCRVDRVEDGYTFAYLCSSRRERGLRVGDCLQGWSDGERQASEAEKYIKDGGVRRARWLSQGLVSSSASASFSRAVVAFGCGRGPLASLSPGRRAPILQGHSSSLDLGHCGVGYLQEPNPPSNRGSPREPTPDCTALHCTAPAQDALLLLHCCCCHASLYVIRPDSDPPAWSRVGSVSLTTLSASPHAALDLLAPAHP